MRNNFQIPVSACLALICFPCFASPIAVVPQSVDPAAVALLAKVKAESKSLESLSANTTLIYRSSKQGLTVRIDGNIGLKKPSYASIHQSTFVKKIGSSEWKQRGSGQKMISDGREITFVEDKKYHKAVVTKESLSRLIRAIPTDDFFDPSKSELSELMSQQGHHTLIALKLDKPAVWWGTLYNVIVWQTKLIAASPGLTIARIYVGADNIVHRVTVSTTEGDPDYMDIAYHDLTTDAPLAPSAFKYIPPTGFQNEDRANALDHPLANGNIAPDFEAVDAVGHVIHLSDFKGRTLILNFWSTWVGTSRKAMPSLERFSNAVRPYGVTVLSVCVWDDKSAFLQWMSAPTSKYTFANSYDPAGHNAINIASSQYHVIGIPTQFLIDKSGRIITSSIGYDPTEAKLKSGLNQLGIIIHSHPKV